MAWQKCVSTCAFALTASAGVAEARDLVVNLRASNGQYVVAENGGGGVVNANRSAAYTWETFTLLDINGGELNHNDVVALKTHGGRFLSAPNDGLAGLRATGTTVGAAERFQIRRSGGAGAIAQNGSDAISLLSLARNRFVVAENGGGSVVNVNRTAAGPWERFTLVSRGRPQRVARSLSAPFLTPSPFTPPIGIDHDGAEGAGVWDCENFQGLPAPGCYDGHTGMDFGIFGGFAAMDLGSFDVVAAAGGFVVQIADGNADRCFFDPTVPEEPHIRCPNNPDLNANFVVVRQDDGLFAHYYHLQRGTVAVSAGQRIECGARLGRVGSSGISSGPHLHFELRDRGNQAPPATGADQGRDGAVVDPYQENLWAILDGLLPRNVCSGRGAVCRQETSRLECDNAPQARLCEGLDEMHATLCLATGPTCEQTCGDVCEEVTEEVCHDVTSNVCNWWCPPFAPCRQVCDAVTQTVCEAGGRILDCHGAGADVCDGLDAAQAGLCAVAGPESCTLDCADVCRVVTAPRDVLCTYL